MAEPPVPVDAERQALLGALARHGVRFVLIGGAALQTHGREYQTLDVDIAPDQANDNLDHLAAALEELECRLMVEPDDDSTWIAVPRGYFTAATLRRAAIWNLATRHGQLDVTFVPSGFPDGYRQLRPNASRRPAAGTTIVVDVASLEDVEHSKRTAGRPKDLAYLEREERRRPLDAGA
jgi:hypothetical protein